MSAATLVNAIHGRLSQGLREQAAQLASVRANEAAKAGGKAEGEAPLEMAKVQMQGANAAAMAKIHGDTALQGKLLEYNLKLNDVDKVVPNGDGSSIITVGPNAFHYTPAPPARPGQPQTYSQLVPIKLPG